jgi:acetyl esterase
MTDLTSFRLRAVAERMRSEYTAVSSAAAGSPDPVAEVRDIVIPTAGAGRSIPARLYVPVSAGEEPNGLPIVVFAHGGGFTSGDLDTHDVLARAIALRSGAVVLAVDYRLAPEHPYPAGLEDLYTALQWVAGSAAEINADASRIVVAGDSAGGNLVASLAMLSRDRGGPPLVAQWLMYATLSNKMDTPSWEQFGDTHMPTREMNSVVIASYVPPNLSPHDPLVAPLWGEHHELPPALIQVGEFDPLRDENIAYAAALQEAGGQAEVIVYPGNAHGFLQFFKNERSSPGGRRAIEDGARFLRANFSWT